MQFTSIQSILTPLYHWAQVGIIRMEDSDRMSGHLNSRQERALLQSSAVLEYYLLLQRRGPEILATI